MLLPVFISIAILLQAPCPPKTTACATGCVPIGETCPSAAELAPPEPPAPEPREGFAPRPSTTPGDTPRDGFAPAATEAVSEVEERAPSAKETRQKREGCEEGDADFYRRRMKRLAAFGAPGLGLGVAGGITALTMREPVDQEGGPNCTVGKRCGNSCIAVEDECHKGSGLNSRLTTAGLVTTIVLLVVSASLLFAGVLSSRRMERRRVDCTRDGCALTLRF